MAPRKRQLRTLDYSQADRDRLADAVTNARLAAGHKFRTTFAQAAGVSVRSLTALELGEPGVGQATLFAVARELPGWTADTPKKILEGAAAPEMPADAAEPSRDEIRAEVIRRLANVREHYPQEYAALMDMVRSGEVSDKDIDQIMTGE